MNWQGFHHPDICWPVIRRRAATEFLELVELGGLFLAKGGWGLLNRSCYPNPAAYRNAKSRLKQQGLLVFRSEEGVETPTLVLSDEARNSLPDYFDPEKWWSKKWNSIWSLLIYDVPEMDRPYRDVLRRFLKQKRLGCLQKSVWVTPTDIRPEFDDLSKAAAVDTFAFLFEAQTVLGLPNRSIVETAWDFDQLEEIQAHYCEVMEININRLTEESVGRDELVTLVRMSLDAYHAAFRNDPLLPRELHPVNYLGARVLDLHRCLFTEIDSQLQARRII